MQRNRVFALPNKSQYDLHRAGGQRKSRTIPVLLNAECKSIFQMSYVIEVDRQDERTFHNHQRIY